MLARKYRGENTEEKRRLTSPELERSNTIRRPLTAYIHCLEGASPAFEIALLGMPFDTSVTYQPGAYVALRWIPLVQRPFFSLPEIVRYGLGWLALLAIIVVSAFGFKIELPLDHRLTHPYLRY